MTPARSRLRWLIAIQALALGLGPACTGRPGSAAAPRTVAQARHLKLERLTEGVFFWRPTRAGREVVGSAGGFIETPKGLLMIDACQTPEGAREALAQMADRGARPLRWAVVTHPHEDHEGGLGALGPEVQVLRHPLSETLDLPVEGLSIEHPGPGHTAADLWVWVETKDGLALFAGDLYVNGYIGYLGEGHLKEWAAALRRAAERRPRWVIGGHGPIGDAAGLKAYADYIDAFRRDARRHFEAGGKPKTYRLPKRYDHLGARSFLQDNVERAWTLWREGAL